MAKDGTSEHNLKPHLYPVLHADSLDAPHPTTVAGLTAGFLKGSFEVAIFTHILQNTSSRNFTLETTNRRFNIFIFSDNDLRHRTSPLIKKRYSIVMPSFFMER
jgi:hypothetical protein